MSMWNPERAAHFFNDIYARRKIELGTTPEDFRWDWNHLSDLDRAAMTYAMGAVLDWLKVPDPMPDEHTPADRVPESLRK